MVVESAHKVPVFPGLVQVARPVHALVTTSMNASMMTGNRRHAPETPRHFTQGYAADERFHGSVRPPVLATGKNRAFFRLNGNPALWHFRDQGISGAHACRIRKSCRAESDEV